MLFWESGNFLEMAMAMVQPVYSYLLHLLHYAMPACDGGREVVR